MYEYRYSVFNSNSTWKTAFNNSLPEHTLNIIRQINVFAVENIPSAVKFLKWVGDAVPEYKIDFYQLNKKTPEHEILSLLKPLKSGRDMGVLSEAGARNCRPVFFIGKNVA